MSRALRVQYRERQRLLASELRAEQEYLLGLAGRHNVGVHTWGIVRGLIVVAQDRVVTVFPGLAIDGYGRVLLVSAPIVIEMTEDPIDHHVYLFYCQRVKGGCGPNPNTMFKDSAEVTVLKDVWPHPSDQPEIESALLAGNSCEQPVWPIYLGQLKDDNDANTPNRLVTDRLAAQFVRIRATRIVSPSGAVVCRLGMETPSDKEPFRISVRNQSRQLQDRFVVDRDGNPKFYGDLIITDSILEPLKLKVGTASLVFQPDAAVGGYVTWRTREAMQGGERKLIIEFRDRAARVEQFEVRLNATIAQAEETLEHQNEQKRFDSITLLDNPLISPANVRRRTRSRSRISLPAFLPAGSTESIEVQGSDHEVPLRYRATILSVKREEPPNDHDWCGCDAKVIEEESSFPRIVFGIAKSSPQTSTRDIYSIRTGSAENEREELRLNLGAFAEGDFRRHFSVGTRKQVSNSPYDVFIPWMQVRGNGAVEIPGGDEDKADRPIMLNVKGTLTLPPVKPDPADPLFKDLLQLCFLNGVLSHGASPLNFTPSNIPAFIETDQDWHYDLTLLNGGSDDLIHPDGREIYNDRPPSIGVQNLPDSLIIGRPQTVTINHHGLGSSFNASTLSIQLTVIMETKTDHRKVGFQRLIASSIEVIKSPSMNLTNLPVEVPAGWRFPITLKNLADRKLTITDDVTVTLPSGDRSLPLLPTELDHNDIADTADLIQIPHGITEFQVDASIPYMFPNKPGSVLTKSHLFQVLEHYGADIDTSPSPIPAGLPWKYRLNLTNTSGETIRLKKIKVRIYLQDSTPPDFENYTSNTSLDDGDTYSRSDLSGLSGPSGTPLTLDVMVSYQRINVTWSDISYDAITITIP